MKKNLRRVVLLSILILLFVSAVIFAEEESVGPQLPAISFQKDPTSDWEFDLDMEDFAISFYHPDYPDYTFEIDCDGTTSVGL